MYGDINLKKDSGSFSIPRPEGAIGKSHPQGLATDNRAHIGIRPVVEKESGGEVLHWRAISLGAPEFFE